MSTRKRVEAYLWKWAGQGVDANNGCAIFRVGNLDKHQIAYPSEVDGMPLLFELWGNAKDSMGDGLPNPQTGQPMAVDDRRVA